MATFFELSGSQSPKSAAQTNTKKSSSETGHAKNIANFEDLISFCIGYGITYNPVNLNIKVTALQTKQAATLAVLQSVKSTKTAFDNSTNAREVLFAALKKLATRIVNGLDATTATAQTVDDAKTINRKIQGKRANNSVKLPKATAKLASTSAVTDPPPTTLPVDNTISVSQQSFDSLIDNFTKLIQTVTAEPLYVPNETELKVTSLNTLLASLKTANTGVINATTGYSNARISRNSIMYAEDTGLSDLAKEVKKYVKSLFGATSPQYKQISKLKFTQPR